MRIQNTGFPSELRKYGLTDNGNSMTVHSRKTEHHEGGECRVVPIFPELRPYLDAIYDEAEDGTELSLRDTATAISTCGPN